MIWQILAALATRRGIFNLVTVVFLAALLWGIVKTPAWDGGLITAAIIAAALAALVGNFEQLEFFKASAIGIEARTRAVVERAETAVAELHSLAELTGATLVALIAGAGRWGGMDKGAKENQKALLLTKLKVIGLSDAALKRVETADKDYVVADYARHIVQRFEWSLKRRSVSEGYVSLRRYTDENFQYLTCPNPEDLHSFLQSLAPIEDEVLQLLDDYRYYLTHGKHRRPEKWREIADE